MSGSRVIGREKAAGINLRAKWDLHAPLENALDARGSTGEAIAGKDGSVYTQEGAVHKVPSRTNTAIDRLQTRHAGIMLR